MLIPPCIVVVLTMCSGTHFSSRFFVAQLEMPEKGGTLPQAERPMAFQGQQAS